MKKIAVAGVFLPMALLAQSGAPTITSRVAGILANGIGGGTQGLYLKQVGGAVLAAQQTTFVFDPATASAVVPLLYAMGGVQTGSWSLTQTPVPRYSNAASSCPNPALPDGTEPLGTALREMGWHSDNARTHALQVFFGRTNVLDPFSRSLGLRNLTLPQIPGCQAPGRATLADLMALYDGVASGALLSSGRSVFFGSLAGKAQAAAETFDHSHLWDTDIPAVIRQEAPAGVTQAQMTAFQNGMDLGYKTGSAALCPQGNCSTATEDLSIAGWAKIPYCSGNTTVAREFVFGLFLSGVPDVAWTPGKSTAAQKAFAAARAELLREQIRDGIGSCYGGDAVLVTPAPGSTLSGRTVGFAWSGAANAAGYRLDVGKAPGGTEFGTVFTSTTGAVFTNLPCNGSNLYARLWTRTDLYANPKDYTFRACSNGGPVITSPAPGTTLTAPSVTFAWSAINDADGYRISVGSTLGGNDIELLTPASTSTTVNNIPLDGRIVFVRIQAHTAAGYSNPNDFAYNNLAGQSPVVASVLNAVTLLPNISPACLAILNGSNFASDVVVTVGGAQAQIAGAPSASRIAFVVPPGLAPGRTSVVISSGAAASAPLAVTLSDTSPALYSPILDANGAPLPAGRSFKPGDTAVARAIGLGPLGSDGRPSARLRLTVGGVAASLLSTAPLASSPGVVQISFRVPAGPPSGGQPVVVEAGSNASNPVSLIMAGPSITAVTSAATFSAGGKVAPGSIVSVFGSDLATEDSFGVFPSAALPGGGAITINGVSAPLFDVVPSGGQVNLLVPFETPVTGSVSVVVTNSLGASQASPLAMAPAAPGIFRIADPANPKRWNAAALLANTAWRVMPVSMAAALGMPQDCRANRVPAAAICGEPAAPGADIAIYVTGLGRATVNGSPVGNQLRTGDAAPASGSVLYKTVETPLVTIGGVEAAVVFSGVAPGYAGLYQINVTIPPTAPEGDDIPVTVTMGGISDTATIAIRRP